MLGDFSYVALPFVAQGVGCDFVAHALLHEGTELALIIDLDDFLRPIGGVGDVELHLDEVARSRR